MPRLVGNDGSAFIVDHPVIIDSFTLTIETFVGDVSGFDDVWAAKRAGRKMGSFALTGHLDDAVASKPDFVKPSPEGSAIVLSANGQVTPPTVPTTGRNWNGTGVVGTCTVTANADSDMTISIDGEFDGAVVETWTDS